MLIQRIILCCIIFIPIHIKADEFEIVPGGSFSNPDFFAEESAMSERVDQKKQRFSVFASILIHNTPFVDLSILNHAYLQKYNPWKVGQSAMGGALGVSYDIMMSQHSLFRMQAQLETTGWISGILDIGFGIRLPSGKKNNFSMDVYFSFLQSGTTLLYSDQSKIEYHVNEFSLYIAAFGFKGRIAYEFALSNDYFLTPYISYAAYPWMVYNIKERVALNGSESNKIIDSLQLGFEVGWKF